MPKMRHRSGGRQIEVSPDMVAMYESQGWQKVTATTASKKTSEPAKGSK